MPVQDPIAASPSLKLGASDEAAKRQIVLRFQVGEKETETWVCWSSGQPGAETAADAFNLDLKVEESLIEQLLEPGWKKHPRIPGQNEPLSLSPPMRVALESLRRCPFSGASRELFHNARRNDLLLGFAELIRQGIGPEKPWSNLTLESRLREAAKILENELEHPPSVETLARRVSLSESTLKRGFREYYGDTVFGLLRKLRMSKARALLESGKATVLEASTLVGYSNPSNFAAAFRTEFGQNPKQFQLSLKQDQRPPGGA